jgi:SAM-dependent methyltransferase
MARRGDTAHETHVAEALLERLATITRPPANALVINTGSGLLAQALRDQGLVVSETDHGARFALAAGAVHCDEDRLPLGNALTPASYDLVAIPAGLDTIDDLPGALIAARRALRPDGLLLAALWGAPGLVMLRQSTQAADAASGASAARLHPQIDVKGAGDLLVRAGYAMPVADAETLRLSYTGLDRLIDDLRGAGATSALAERHPVGRDWLRTARDAFAALAGPDGRTVEQATLIVLTAWSPAPGQPQPARRGSATASLADALRSKP